MGCMACTEPQCLYKGALYFFLHHVVPHAITNMYIIFNILSPCGPHSWCRTTLHYCMTPLPNIMKIFWVNTQTSKWNGNDDYRSWKNGYVFLSLYVVPTGMTHVMYIALIMSLLQSSGTWHSSCGSVELYYLPNYTASHPGSHYLNTH